MIAQAVSAGSAFSSFGNCGTRGITTVCMSETTIPVKASTQTTVFAPGGAEGAAGVCGRALDMVSRPSGRAGFGRGLNQLLDLG
ncbi:hypothetical protein GCM10010428_76970 [Actinosynnema pretiosum subsp. pretiosum]